MPRDDNLDDILCNKPASCDSTVIASGFSEDFMSANRHIYKLLSSGIRKELRILNIRPMGRDVWIKCETPDQASTVIDFLNSRRFTKAYRSTESAPARDQPQRPPYPPSDSHRDGRPVTPRSSSYGQSIAQQSRSPHKSFSERSGGSHDRYAERTSPVESPSSTRSYDSRKRGVSFESAQRNESETDRSRKSSREERPYTPSTQSGQRAFEHPPPLQPTGTEDEELDDMETQRIMNNHFFELTTLGKKSIRDLPRQVSVTNWRELPCTETLLYKLLAPFGGIWSVKVAGPAQGFVTFVHPGSAQAAMHFASLTGLYVNDTRLAVSVVLE